MIVKASAEECRYTYDLLTCILFKTPSLNQFWKFYSGEMEGVFYTESKYRISYDGIVRPAKMYYTNPVFDLAHVKTRGCSFQHIFPLDSSCSKLNRKCYFKKFNLFFQLLWSNSLSWRSLLLLPSK